MAAHFSDTDIYDRIEVVAAITYEDIVNRLASYDNTRSALSVVNPVE
jgi:hypothetical protein